MPFGINANAAITDDLSRYFFLRGGKPVCCVSTRPATPSRIADNKKAAYNYFFEEKFEAGMVLEGWEVKAAREGKVQFTDGYVVIRDGEHDKRDTIKDREGKREVERAMKSRSR